MNQAANIYAFCAMLPSMLDVKAVDKKIWLISIEQPSLFFIEHGNSLSCLFSILLSQLLSYMMKLILRSFAPALFITVLFCGSKILQADVVWNESVNGDLSSNPDAPTFLNFANGSNTVVGSISEPDGDPRDYMTFTIGPNQFLTGLTLDAYGPPGVSFQGINAGNTSFIPSTATAGSFLGLDFVQEGLIGVDMLPILAIGEYGSTGFTVPLGPGNYTYLIQELTGGESRSYQLTFSVVPEPSSVAMLGGMALICMTRRSRRRPG